MELNTEAKMSVGTTVRLTRGNLEGRVFQKQSSGFWRELWSNSTMSQPKTWIGLHVTALMILAGLPEVVLKPSLEGK